MSVKTRAYVLTFAPLSILSIFCQNIEIPGLIKATARVSYSDCVKECNELRSCRSFNYVRAAALCSLSSIVQTQPAKPGVYMYSKDVAGGNIDMVFCGDPTVNFLGTKRYGNFRLLGSKIKYECEDGSNAFDSTCLDDGTWSNVDEFICVSPEPRDAFNNVPIEHVAFWMIEETTDTTIKAKAICKEGYTPRVAAKLTATFDIQAQIWTGVEDICCERFDDGDWRKVYSYPATNTSGYVFGAWIQGNGFTDYCQYRDSSCVDLWESKSITEVKLSIIKNSQDVAWAIFDGQGSNKQSWMDRGRLLNSSWSGLNRYSGSDYYIGFHYDDTYESKYYIGLTEKRRDPTGWLNVRFSAVPDDDNGRRTIIYSLTPSAEVLDMAYPDLTKVGLADRLEIWIKSAS